MQGENVSGVSLGVSSNTSTLAEPSHQNCCKRDTESSHNLSTCRNEDSIHAPVHTCILDIAARPARNTTMWSAAVSLVLGVTLVVQTGKKLACILAKSPILHLLETTCHRYSGLKIWQLNCICLALEQLHRLVMLVYACRSWSLSRLATQRIDQRLVWKLCPNHLSWWRWTRVKGGGLSEI